MQIRYFCKKIQMNSFVVIITIITLFTVSCQRNKSNSIPSQVINNPLSAEDNGNISSELPVISFETTTFDFGKIYEGEKVKYSFKFTNTGKSDLLISKVSASCGCTVAEYPKKPIRPGQTESITVEFNSSGRRGQQSKTVAVMTNAQPSTIVLTVKAMVVEP